MDINVINDFVWLQLANVKYDIESCENNILYYRSEIMPDNELDLHYLSKQRAIREVETRLNEYYFGYWTKLQFPANGI